MAPISLANTFIPSKDAAGLISVDPSETGRTTAHLTAVLDDLRTEYDAPPDVLERDLLDLVARLVDARLGEVK